MVTRIYKLALGIAIGLSAVPIAFSENSSHLPKFHDCSFDPIFGGHSYEQRSSIFNVLKTYQLQSQPAAEFSYKLKKNGSLVSTTLSDSGGVTTPEAFYYYEQSIWEAAPFVPIEKDAEDFDFNIVFKGSTEARTTTASELVWIHVIPAAVLRLYPGKFELEEITSDQNQRKFDVKYSKSQTLLAFRSEWQQFLLSHKRASRTEISKKGKELEARFLLSLQGRAEVSANLK